MSNAKRIRQIERRIAVKKDALIAVYQLTARFQRELDALELELSELQCARKATP